MVHIFSKEEKDKLIKCINEVDISSEVYSLLNNDNLINWMFEEEFYRYMFYTAMSEKDSIHVKWQEKHEAFEKEIEKLYEDVYKTDDYYGAVVNRLDDNLSCYSKTLEEYSRLLEINPLTFSCSLISDSPEDFCKKLSKIQRPIIDWETVRNISGKKAEDITAEEYQYLASAYGELDTDEDITRFILCMASDRKEWKNYSEVIDSDDKDTAILFTSWNIDATKIHKLQEYYALNTDDKYSLLSALGDIAEKRDGIFVCGNDRKTHRYYFR